MYRFKVHCRDTILKKMGKPVFIDISEKSKQKAMDQVKIDFPHLKPQIAYFVAIVEKKKVKKDSFN